jgi:hypothetical protein
MGSIAVSCGGFASFVGVLRWARGAGMAAGCRGPGRRSAGGGWEGFEPPEGGGELFGPGPGALQVELRLAAVERQAAGDVKQSVAQSFRFGLGELAFEQQRLGPDDQVVRNAGSDATRSITRNAVESDATGPNNAS